MLQAGLAVLIARLSFANASSRTCCFATLGVVPGRLVQHRMLHPATQDATHEAST